MNTCGIVGGVTKSKPAPPLEMSTNRQGIEAEPSKTVPAALDARRGLFRASDGLSAKILGVVIVAPWEDIPQQQSDYRAPTDHDPARRHRSRVPS